MTRAALRRTALALVGTLVLIWAWAVGVSSASAHPMPHSVVTMDVHDADLTANLELPFDDLRLATGFVLDPATTLADEGDRLEAYILEHLQVTTLAGEEWAVSIDDLEVTEGEQTSTGVYNELIASLTLTPPEGASTRQFILDDDVIIHQVVTHTILVAVGEDWSTGDLDGETSEVGVIRVDTGTGEIAPLEIDLGAGSMWSGFVAMVGLGGTHILEGTDHLLFLIVLLLPAPLIAVAGRWTRRSGTRSAVRRMLGITIAFTIGHSLTLAVSALTRLDIPAAPVEALIALSILVGAVHAIRPLFPGREAVVAGLFGLVHGMAFSFTLAELGLSTPQLVVSLLGFNLGIELLQLAVVLAVLPALLILSAWSGYLLLRVSFATVAAVCASGWLLARLGVPNAIADLADALAAYGGWAVVGLWVLAAGVYVYRRARPAEPESAVEEEPAVTTDEAADSPGVDVAPMP